MWTNFKERWEYIQNLLDLDGDIWMGLFTLAIVARVLLVIKGHKPLNTGESMAYGSAIGAFAYSNRGPKGPKGV